MPPQASLALLILGVLADGPRHGYAIAQEIQARSQGLLSAKEGSLYPALHALEAQGRVEAEEVEVNGRSRRRYRLTESGLSALREERARWERQVGAVRGVLNGLA